MSQIIFRETHICVVGEACPQDVVESIGGYKRCGACPFAMRCVDHLPGIEAKIRDLKIAIRFNQKTARQMEKRGEPPSVVDSYHEASELDAMELLGWQASQSVLHQMLKDIRSGKKVGKYHSFQPDMVKHHISAVSKNRSQAEYFLDHMADGLAYPSLAGPEIRKVAERHLRMLMGGKFDLQDEDDDPLITLAVLLKTNPALNTLTIEDLAARLAEFEQRLRKQQENIVSSPSAELGPVIELLGMDGEDGSDGRQTA